MNGRHIIITASRTVALRGQKGRLLRFAHGMWKVLVYERRNPYHPKGYYFLQPHTFKVIS